jgi:hypothetical protein
MCEAKKYHKTSNTRIDSCMKRAMNTLSNLLESSPFSIIACCCGHGKYPMSIVIGFDDGEIHPYPFELFTGRLIRRRRKFYKRDKQGYYYIPETVLPTKHNFRLKKERKSDNK